MSNSLVELSQKAKSAYRMLKAIGPLLISQTQVASENFALHKLRMAKVEATKKFMLEEATSYARIKDGLLEKYHNSTDGLERFEIKKRLEDVDGEIRKLGIVSKALDYVSESYDGEPAIENNEVNDNPEENPISDHWLDKFNDYARARNEDWRKDLLAKALAVESKNPGSIGARALWLIGIMEEEVFHAYASILDICTNIGGEHIVPNHIPFNDEPIPNSALGMKSIGNMTFMLTDLGVIADTLTSQRIFSAKTHMVSSYDNTRNLLFCKKEFAISGVVPTVLGENIAKLYTPKPNDLGRKIYQYWLDNINPNVAEMRDTIIEDFEKS